MEISLNGGASSGNIISLDLDAGNATAALKAATADSDQHGRRPAGIATGQAAAVADDAR